MRPPAADWSWLVLESEKRHSIPEVFERLSTREIYGEYGPYEVWLQGGREDKRNVSAKSRWSRGKNSAPALGRIRKYHNLNCIDIYTSHLRVCLSLSEKSTSNIDASSVSINCPAELRLYTLGSWAHLEGAHRTGGIFDAMTMNPSESANTNTTARSKLVQVTSRRVRMIQYLQVRLAAELFGNTEGSTAIRYIAKANHCRSLKGRSRVAG